MTLRIDLSPTSLLNFEKEKEEAKQLLLDRKGLTLLLDWGKDPLFQPIEPFLLAATEFKNTLFPLYQSVIKSIYLFPLDQHFFISPLKAHERADYEERSSFRVDLFRRDLLSEFLIPIAALFGDKISLRLDVQGPPYWIHPDKFPWVERKKNGSLQGILLPALETDEILHLFETIELGNKRLLTEQNLSLEWEGLEELEYVEEGVSRQGRRALKGFEAAGGLLKGVPKERDN